ncbi:hypothetical protein EPO15_01655 [bacterium]|nr:MAG: hypothetical protein EPO15_01655 [bacterium]
MAPAALLALAALVAAAGPLSGRAPSAEEVALSSATLAYKNALERYNGYVVLNGSVQDETAVSLHAAKENARRAMVRAEQAAGQKHARIGTTDGPLVEPAPLPARVPEGAPPRVAPAGRGAVLAGGLVIGGALLGVGGYGWWKRRPRMLTCPGCARKLKVPGRGLKTRCPKCKKVFDA